MRHALPRQLLNDNQPLKASLAALINHNSISPIRLLPLTCVAAPINSVALLVNVGVVDILFADVVVDGVASEVRVRAASGGEL
jgi:hypothetical protein